MQRDVLVHELVVDGFRVRIFAEKSVKGSFVMVASREAHIGAWYLVDTDKCECPWRQIHPRGEPCAHIKLFRKWDGKWPVPKTEPTLTRIVGVPLNEIVDDPDDAGEGWVDIMDVIGRRTIPEKSAAILKRALNRMVALGDVPAGEDWIGLEYLAAEYLGGH